MHELYAVPVARPVFIKYNSNGVKRLCQHECAGTGQTEISLAGCQVVNSSIAEDAGFLLCYTVSLGE